MKQIPYGKQLISEEDIQEVTKALRGEWITGGPKVKEFEDTVASFCQASFGIAVSNGTAALDIAVQALELPPGSEIITTPLTFIATINSILFNGHVPVLADIRPDTYNIDPASVERKITPRTKAIIVVDYAGQPCDMEELKAITQRHNLFLIEDAAQSLGAEYQGKKVGSFADMTTLSFHPVKHITTGEGGMVLTDDPEFSRRLHLLRNHGMDKEAQERFGPSASWRFDIKHLARNYRLTDFQSALGMSQLRQLEPSLRHREKIAKKYGQHFQGNPSIQVPFVSAHVRHAWHLYPILLNGIDRDLFFKKMKEKNIGVNVHHIPPYEFTYHRRFGWSAADLPVTDSVFRRTITLPIHASLTEEEQTYIITSVQDIIKELQGKKEMEKEENKKEEKEK